ncbi:AI-2E family transporter [Aureispira sp. CCB-E]|uniref:AI-2E family transporter n=1 Tax=Aureispira sp. CCB-E TaxID=3051121 RepID=UPI002868675B|nr:AI-2E family transporter [Aureispira sp. CCB-E]WMX15096.1 AI-2E family transporter [Aureispira sp. CCB-E]
MQPIIRKYSRYIGALLSITIACLIIYYFSDIFTWVVLAWVISLLGSPLMKLMGRIRYRGWEIPNSIRALVVLFLFYGIFGLLFYIFVPVIVKQGQNLAEVDYTAIVTSLEEPIAHFNDWLIVKGLSGGELSTYADSTNLIEVPVDSVPTTTAPASPSNIKTYTNVHIDSLILANGDTIPQTHVHLKIALNVEPMVPVDTTVVITPSDTPSEQLRKKMFEYVSPSQIITRTLLYMFSFFGNFMVLMTSVTFIAFFFLKDEQLFGRVLKAIVPNQQKDEADTALSQIKRLLTRYFSGILLQITLITLYVTVLLSFFNIPNAFLIAFFAAIVNVIPYLGPIIGTLFGMLVIISSNLDMSFYMVTLPMILKVMGVFASMQILDGFVLQPYIFSNSVSAHPLEIFIVVVVGAKLGGITGMVVAIPAYTIIRVIASVFLKEFQLVQKLTQSLSASKENIDVGENVDIEVED